MDAVAGSPLSRGEDPPIGFDSDDFYHKRTGVSIRNSRGYPVIGHYETGFLFFEKIFLNGNSLDMARDPGIGSLLYVGARFTYFPSVSSCRLDSI